MNYEGVIRFVRMHEEGRGVKKKRTIAYKGEEVDTLVCVRKIEK